jgi:hypothetical protein
MVALTYDVRTVRIPVPRLALRAPRRTPRPAAVVEHWQRLEREADDRRRDAHRAAALASHS